MATNPALKKALLEKLAVSPQRLSQRVVEMKRDHGPMSTDDATYVIGHLEGLDLTKYLDKPAVDRVRGLVPGRSAPGVGAEARPTREPRSRPRWKTPTLRPVSQGDLFLSDGVVQDARRMADLYLKMYLLENSLRRFIDRVLAGRHGRAWWDVCTSSELKKLVQGRKDKEEKVPWHGKRGAHEIYYSDFADLKNIIVKNWAAFEPILRKQQWISQWLEELEPARNTIAHHNPVNETERKRLEVFYDDWVKLIEATGSSIGGEQTESTL